MRSINAGARPRYLPFWGHRPRRDGQLDKACLSQWWPARFDADNETFGSAEHYMMWRKALLFDDAERAAAVLTSPSPAQAKAIGRQVPGFDEAVWVQHRWDIVVAASIAKFSSDPGLRDFLLFPRGGRCWSRRRRSTGSGASASPPTRSSRRSPSAGPASTCWDSR